ncbi:Esyt3 [Symbiodinium natans]|uniref:Esyt3 protein n=1 Tax=Symbiodinium natans TaxID=878477 RepID=A0A812L1R1_9DINO|nr:Esyt3 [Symbiodinium natans]
MPPNGINTTFCGNCYRGLCSAGQGSGVGSPWNNYLLDEVVRSRPFDRLASQFSFVKNWSMGAYITTPLSVTSPFVIGQPDGQKQFAVELVRQWYENTFGFSIEKQQVYFFDDRMDNIPPFKEQDLAAKQISCHSRDLSYANGTIGLCGALPEQIVQPGTESNPLCADLRTPEEPITGAASPWPSSLISAIERA